MPRRDEGASTVVGLVAAGVVYLLAFLVLFEVAESPDTTRPEQAVLEERAGSALQVLTGGTGEAPVTITTNRYLLQDGTQQKPLAWTVDSGTTLTFESTGGAQTALRVDGSQGKAVRSSAMAVSPHAAYLVEARIDGAADVKILYYANDESTSLVKTETVLSTSGSGFATYTSPSLTPPPSAASARLEVASKGSAFLVNRTELRVKAVGGWEGNPDGLVRFGLLEDDAASRGFVGRTIPNLVDYGKIVALRSGTMTSQANGAPDYPEVRAALGLGDFNFHLRSYPVLVGVDDPSFAPEKALKLAYVGHYPASNQPPAYTLSVSAGIPGGANYVEVVNTITNQEATAQVFRLTLSLNKSTGGKVVDEQDTILIPPGSTTAAVHRIYGMGAAADWKLGDKIHVRLQDHSSKTLTERYVALPTPADLANSYNVVVQPAKPYFLTSESTVSFYLDHYDRQGNRLNPAPKIDISLRNRANNTIFWTLTNVELEKNKEKRIECAIAACRQAGDYDVLVSRAGGGYGTSEQYAVLPAAPSATTTEGPSSRIESGILSELVATFVNSTDRGLPGDKYRDTKADMDALIATFPRYNILVVGSEVEHSAMTSANVKYGIRDFVWAGGTLVVLGSTSQNVQWLEPLYGTGLNGASGSIGAPDPTHPLLHAPDALSYRSYKDPGTAWTVKRDDLYSHVLVREQQGQSSEDMLAISRPGTVGAGTVVLSAFTPFDLLPEGGEANREEAKRFLHNMVTQGYSMLFVDFGPAVPPGQPVATSSRVVLVPHTIVKGALVEVEMVVYVFR